VRLNDLAHDREAQAGAVGARAPRLPETIEHARDVLRRDPDARVRHPEHDLAAVDLRAQRDAPRPGELGRVADQVLQHLEHPARIGPDVGQGRHQLGPKLQRSRAHVLAL
jgi:hypothetical protein